MVIIGSDNIVNTFKNAIERNYIFKVHFPQEKTKIKGILLLIQPQALRVIKFINFAK